MATIKSLLSTALESFLTSKKGWSTNQVMPADNYIDVVATKRTDISSTAWSFTSSIDGYVKMGAYGLGDSYKSSFYSTGIGSGIERTTFSYATLFFPVSKGQEIVYIADNISSAFIRLYKANSGT